tara:strand:- start:439 stop:903 length:465 start_codon:yes stop_codon:yes gene_type:complete
MSQDDLNLVRTDVEILKKDVSNIQGLLTRLDTAIDKIADASNGIASILAVHESKHEATAVEIVERTRVEEKAIDLLHTRITSKEIEWKQLSDDQHSELMRFLKDHDDRSYVVLDKLSERVASLELWKWAVVGGAWAIGVMIGFESELLMEFLTK